MSFSQRQHAQVHTNSGLPFMFSSATRALIDSPVLQRASSLNSLDAQLFHVAEARLAADLATHASHPAFPAEIVEQLTVPAVRDAAAWVRAKVRVRAIPIGLSQ